MPSPPPPPPARRSGSMRPPDPIHPFRPGAPATAPVPARTRRNGPPGRSLRPRRPPTDTHSRAGSRPAPRGLFQVARERGEGVLETHAPRFALGFLEPRRNVEGRPVPHHHLRERDGN